MKKNANLFFFILLLLFISCSEEALDTNSFDPKQHKTDVEAIKSYLNANHIAADSTVEGLFYIIDSSEGTQSNTYPNVNSTITVSYRGYLMSNGKIFDSQPQAVFLLGNLIEGWKIGLPKFKKGDKGRLFIPSTLGYKKQATSDIPANSNLIFDIEMLDIK